MRIKANDISILLRLLSAGWSVLIVILIAVSFGAEKATALAQFFYISLAGVVTSGFSSFTLSRFIPVNGIGVSLVAVAISSVLVFVMLEMTLIPGSISLMTFGIIATFVMREVHSFMARHRERFATAVIVRDHIWRASFSLTLIYRTLTPCDSALETLFFTATCISFFLELGLILRLTRGGMLLGRGFAGNADANLATPSALLGITSFDILGKLQSLSTAALSIFITSSERYFEMALVTTFILVERSSRPLGLIASQAILDFQKEGTGSRNLLTFLQRLIVNRNVHFIGGVMLFVVVLAFLLVIYEIKTPIGVLTVITLYHFYVPLFNISNAYVVLNAGWRFLAARIAITLTVVGTLILFPNIGFSAILAAILVTMILQDAFLFVWKQRGA
jgi:hypothetical protein